MTNLTIDPHVHSEGSFDGKEPIELILEHANEIDLDAICITDHDNHHKAVEAVEMAENYDDIIVIPGVEVSTKDGHLLALDVDERITPGKPVNETVEIIHEKGGAAVIPHPFQKSRHGVSKRKIEKGDGLETLNAWFITGYQNRRAKKFANKNDFPEFAGSDAHSIGLIGRAYSELKIEKENPGKEDIIKAIKHGDTEVRGRRAPLPKIIYHYVKATVRKTLYYTKKTIMLPLKELKLVKNLLQKLKNRKK